MTFCAFHRNAGQASIAARTASRMPIGTHRSNPDQAPRSKTPLPHRELKQWRELVPTLGHDALDLGCRTARAIASGYDGPDGRPFSRENRTEEATNYPLQRIFQNKPPYGKDRQRYALYLTVFWFPSMCTSERTVKKTVKLSG